LISIVVVAVDDNGFGDGVVNVTRKCSIYWFTNTDSNILCTRHWYGVIMAGLTLK